MTPTVEIHTALKTLWGAQAMPFSAQLKTPLLNQQFSRGLHRLEQLVCIQGSGVIHGPNGVGKSSLVQSFLMQLPEKLYQPILLHHSTLASSDLIRQLCMLLKKQPRFHRSDNVALIQQSLAELERRWPVLILEEAQNLSSLGLEEIRLLSSHRADTGPCFSLLMVGDENLLPRLNMGVNRALLSRLGFCLQLEPWNPGEMRQYIQARLTQAAIQCDPFEAAALELCINSSAGIPRVLNELAQRSFEEAALDNSRSITTQHVQRALDSIPWITRWQK